MKPTRYRTLSSEETEISFPLLECWNPLTRIATIAAQVNKKRVLCRISMEILQERFDASSEAPMEAVVENRAAIERAARKLIEDERYEEDGSIIIRESDL